MTRVLASATVDKLQDIPRKMWEVSVTGQPPYDVRRIYTIEAASDTFAAQEGLRRFVEELEAQG